MKMDQLLQRLWELGEIGKHPSKGDYAALSGLIMTYAASYAAEQVAAEREACVAECKDGRYWFEIAAAIRARAESHPKPDKDAISQPPDLNTCPSCGGPADNGNDRLIPPNPYPCSKCEDISPGS